MSAHKGVDEAKAALEAAGFTPPAAFDRDAAVKDLELQWQDHFHMRDQTWKTLQNSALLFVGVVGLEIYRGTPNIVMAAAYSALILVSVLGFLVAMHHRRIQQQVKFPIILRYEVLLGLAPIYQDILVKQSKGLSTSTFIVVSHLALGFIAVLLLIRKLAAGIEGAAAIGLPG